MIIKENDEDDVSLFLPAILVESFILRLRLLRRWLLGSGESPMLRLRVVGELVASVVISRVEQEEKMKMPDGKEEALLPRLKMLLV